MTAPAVRGPSRPPPFAPPGPARKALMVALGANAVMAWVVILGVYTFLDRVWRGLGAGVAAGSLEAHWSQLETARRLQGLAWVVTAVLFLVWLHRVYGNLGVLGAHRMRFSPRWAVGTFFVPVLNLVWPFLVLREVWNASGADADDAPLPTSTPPLVAAWWATFVTATVLDPGFRRLVEDPASRLAVGGPTLLLFVAQLAEIAAAVLAIVLVLRIDERQGRRLATLEAG